jgi:hypothetical protein
MTSKDGINWNAQVAPEQHTWKSVVFANNQFVAVATGVASSVMIASCE